MRKDVWPYLLRVVDWHEELNSRIPKIRETYFRDLEEWKFVETDVIKQDQEAFKAGIFNYRIN